MEKQFFGFLIVVVSLFYLIPLIPIHFYYWSAAAAFCWIIFKFSRKSEKYINERGYVVLVKENELEHRHIAKQLLVRDLAQNEIVHHINGNKIDNKVQNLCLMDSEKHEHFHAWLKWKKEKSKKYPPIIQQKKVLVDEYGGTLLENLIAPLANEDKDNLELQKKLFEELRKERKRLADEKNVPVYMIFDNKTLVEMSEIMPDSESMMLQVRGVGPYKFQLYGASFINIVKKFKSAG